MPYIALQDTNSNFLDKRLSKRVKPLALSTCSWFKTQQGIKEILSNLTIKVAENLRSTTLTKNLLIVKTLEENMIGGLSRTLGKTTFFFARKLGLLAHRWNNISAQKRACDLSFLLFLTAIYINNLRYSKHKKSYLRMCL